MIPRSSITAPAITGSQLAFGPRRWDLSVGGLTHARICVADDPDANIEILQPPHCSRERMPAWERVRVGGFERSDLETIGGAQCAGEAEHVRVGSVSSKSLYPSRELKRLINRGTISPRERSTASRPQSQLNVELVGMRTSVHIHAPSASAPAPIAVLLMTSPHHSSAPPRYTGCSCCTCLRAWGIAFHKR